VWREIAFRLCPPYGSTHPTALRSSETGGGPACCGAGPPHISQPVSRVLYGARPGPARDGHSSGTPVARRFEQPTRTAGSGHRSWSACRRWRDDRLHAVPIRFCSRWGLPCRSRCRKRGALLPHRFTLTAEPPPSSPRKRGSDSACTLPRKRGRVREGAAAVCSLWHCPWGRPRRTLSGTACPWSPDFPPRPLPTSARAGRKEGPGRPSGRLTGQGMGCGGRSVKAHSYVSGDSGASL